MEADLGAAVGLLAVLHDIITRNEPMRRVFDEEVHEGLCVMTGDAPYKTRTALKNVDVLMELAKQAPKP